MSQTLEQRVEQLEKKFAELASQPRDSTPPATKWQETFGLSREDAGFDEMVRLGREYRENLRTKDRLAGS